MRSSGGFELQRCQIILTRARRELSSVLPLGHAMLIVDCDAEQTGRGESQIIRQDANQNTPCSYGSDPDRLSKRTRLGANLSLCAMCEARFPNLIRKAQSTLYWIQDFSDGELISE